MLHEIMLEPFSIDTTTKLVTRELSAIAHTINEDAITTIANVSQGSPLLLWKIIEYAKESNFRDIDAVAASINDNSLIIFMMEKVSQTQRVIMKAASIIGESFDISVLEDIVGDMKLYVETACRTLEEMGLLVELSQGTYCFSSPSMRKFVYDLIPMRYIIP